MSSYEENSCSSAGSEENSSQYLSAIKLLQETIYDSRHENPGPADELDVIQGTMKYINNLKRMLLEADNSTASGESSLEQKFSSLRFDEPSSISPDDQLRTPPSSPVPQFQANSPLQDFGVYAPQPSYYKSPPPYYSRSAYSSPSGSATSSPERYSSSSNQPYFQNQFRPKNFYNSAGSSDEEEPHYLRLAGYGNATKLTLKSNTKPRSTVKKSNVMKSVVKPKHSHPYQQAIHNQPDNYYYNPYL